MNLALGILAAVLASGQEPKPPTEYMGVDAVLSHMRQPPNGSALADPSVIFAHDLVGLGSQVRSLPAAEAATRWLALVHRVLAFSESEREQYGSDAFTQVIAALPAPDAWPLIPLAVESGSFDSQSAKQKLLLLMDVLSGNLNEAANRVKSLEADYKDMNDRSLEELKMELALRRGDAGAVERELTHQADARTETPRIFSNFGGPSLSIPDLVPILGVERTEKLLTRILLTAKAELIVGDLGGRGGATEDIARRLATRLAAQVAWPQWSLACSLEAGNVFETYKRRFPKVWLGITNSNPPSGSTIDDAALYCFANKVLAGKVGEAQSFAASRDFALRTRFGGFLADELAEQLDRRKRLTPVIGLLRKLATEHPNSEMPDLYVECAQGHDSPAQIEEVLKRSAKRATADYRRENARSRLQRLYLAQGKLNAVLGLLPAKDASSSYAYDSGGAGKLLLALGRELKRPDLTQRGLNLAAESVFGFDEVIGDEPLPSLLRQGFGPRIERKLVANLRASVGGRLTESPPSSRSAATELSKFYFAVGRYRDVITLLEQFPGWDAPDLNAIGSSSEDEEVLFAVAKSLAMVGRGRESVPILNYGLAKDPDNDAEYDLLLRLDARSATSTLEALSRQYPAKARPVIWRAVQLLRAGNLSGAESVAQRAIALDPASIENWSQPSRFKAYEVLAEVAKQRHRVQDARRFGAYREAAQLATEAARLASTGLTASAIKLYSKELALVPTDFRVRVEVAMEEVELGRQNQAEFDIRKAFHDVPPKGSVPWTEYALQYRTPIKARRAAESILKEQAKQGSKNPGVFAYLGMFQGQDGDTDAAIRTLRTALQLDPHSLLAAEALTGLNCRLPADLSLQASEVGLWSGSELGIYRDPGTSDYRTLWLAAAQAASRRMDVAKRVFDLPASRASLESSGSSEYVQEARQSPWQSGFEPPGHPIAGDPLVRAIGNLIDRPPVLGDR